jgi:DNA-binding MarR family transcriptional regulator
MALDSNPRPAAQADLAPRLRLAVTRLARRLRREADLPGVSPTQVSALATIERAGPLTLGELAAHEGVQPPTITAAVGRLEEQDLVHRRVDPQDRRVHRVEISAAGRRLLEKNRSRKNAYLERRLRALSSDDRATIERAADLLEAILRDGAERGSGHEERRNAGRSGHEGRRPERPDREPERPGKGAR